MPIACCVQCRQTSGIYKSYDDVRCSYCGRIQPTPLPPRPPRRNPFSEDAKCLWERRRRRDQDTLL